MTSHWEDGLYQLHSCGAADSGGSVQSVFIYVKSRETKTEDE